MFVHGNNIEQKENNLKKYNDCKSKTYLKEIRGKYDLWRVNHSQEYRSIDGITNNLAESFFA